MNRFHRILICAALLAASCTTTEPDTVPAQSSPVTAKYTPQLTANACPVEVPTDTEVVCYTLQVPENRANPEGRTVELPIVRMKSHSPTPAPDPVVYLHGGPGSGTLQRGIKNRADNPILAHRDLILFDQRGSGMATPSLNCPEREDAFLGVLTNASPFPVALQSFDQATKSCYDRLKGQGIDLNQYNTRTNAADLADLRKALNIDQWNLWGVSYGTRLALEAMRSYPEGIRGVLIDSVYPPNAGAADDALVSGKAAFEALSNGCATDPNCAKAYPDLLGTLRTVAGTLNSNPFPFTYTDPSGKSFELKVTGQATYGALFNALYDTTLIPLLPKVLHQLAKGDYSLLSQIGQSAIPFVNDITEGAYLSYECGDQGGRIDADRVAQLRANPEDGDIPLLAGWNLFCDIWQVEPAPKGFASAVKSEIPTLVVAGEYDPITSPAGTKATAEALENAVFLQFPRAGHGPIRDFPCGSTIFTNFWDQLGAVDRSCMDTITPYPFQI